MLNRLKNLFLKQSKVWNIGLTKLSSLHSIERINWYEHSNKNTFVADPFIFTFNNSDYIFVEEYDLSLKKAHISVITTFDKKPVRIITENFHLSYPQVFVHEKNVYCMPEAYKSGLLSLYKCTEFPYKWEKFTTIAEGEIVDATMYFDNEYYWLFYSLQNNIVNEKLFLSYSRNLLGEWHQHPQNPVKESIKSARGAGNIFTFNGDLIRPSQNCSIKYGESITFNRITKLTINEYEECETGFLVPDNEYNDGLHTFNDGENNSIVDGRKVVYSIKSFSEILSHIANKLFTTNSFEE
jgi:hypothetical protein